MCVCRLFVSVGGGECRTLLHATVGVVVIVTLLHRCVCYLVPRDPRLHNYGYEVTLCGDLAPYNDHARWSRGLYS